MRNLVPLLALAALATTVALPAAADTGAKHGDQAGMRTRCGDDSRRERGYVVIFDGSRRCLERWRYSGGASMTRRRNGTLRAGPGAPGLGMLWYAARPYADFSLRLQFRDDAPAAGARANSGVLVRFPPPHPPVPGCPTSQNNPAWVAVNCGHEVQINDSPDGPPNDPRKTGSIYGFQDLSATQARTTRKGVWNDLEIRVQKQHYTVIRNGVKINEYENVPGVPPVGRPNDPDSSSRGLVGYVGLQAHGAAQDVVSFRNIRIKDLSDRD
jgi:hypothetical protein